MRERLDQEKLQILAAEQARIHAGFKTILYAHTPNADPKAAYTLVTDRIGVCTRGTFDKTLAAIRADAVNNPISAALIGVCEAFAMESDVLNYKVPDVTNVGGRLFPEQYPPKLMRYLAERDIHAVHTLDESADVSSSQSPGDQKALEITPDNAAFYRVMQAIPPDAYVNQAARAEIFTALKSYDAEQTSGAPEMFIG